jgi:D-glycero-alpha-D-manno-heptose-7-phosphate kinase
VIIEARAPSRVDLAGGTLDIFPIYLFEEGSVTVNVAVTLMSEVRLETRDDARVVIRSLDLDAVVEADSVEALPLARRLNLLCRAVRFYAPRVGVTIETRNTVRKGSGLGASSSLLIALSGALAHLDGGGRDREDIIHIASLLEAQTISTLTGKQDYYPAMYGGINAIWFGLDENRVEPLLVDEAVKRELHERLILSFGGAPRFSGLTNWRMVRNYMDGDERTRRNMAEIKASAVAMADCLRAGDLDELGRNLAREWACRRMLAKGVTNKRIDSMMKNAEAHGAIASKLCGAGGGGCMITFVEPGAREAVEDSLRRDGAEILDYEIATKGLDVKVVG